MAGKAHERVPVEGVLSRDPAFDKSQRSVTVKVHLCLTRSRFYRHFLARKDVYKRSLAMQNRIDELKEGV